MKLRYSLRTLLILMLVVGPLCVYGWPGYLAWREAQARHAEERREIAKLQQEITRLDQVCRSVGGPGIPARTGKESMHELREMEQHLIREIVVPLFNETGGSRVAVKLELQEPVKLIYRYDPSTGKAKFE